jgi:hypothetical protein
LVLGPPGERGEESGAGIATATSQLFVPYYYHPIKLKTLF